MDGVVAADPVLAHLSRATGPLSLARANP